MTTTTALSPPPVPHQTEKAITLALRLAHAEHALHALTSGQVDAIVDPEGRTYLLRPAQEHLRKNERRLQAVIDSSADVITIVTRRGAILSQSHAVTQVLGYAADELVGTRFFELVHQDDLPAVHFAFSNVIEQFHATATIHFRHRARDGSYRLLEATVGNLRDAASASVVFSLRPVTIPPRARAEPAWPPALDPLPASENRDSITLSHGRRIPLSACRPNFGT